MVSVGSSTCILRAKEGAGEEYNHPHYVNHVWYIFISKLHNNTHRHQNGKSIKLEADYNPNNSEKSEIRIYNKGEFFFFGLDLTT